MYKERGKEGVLVPWQCVNPAAFGLVQQKKKKKCSAVAVLGFYIIALIIMLTSTMAPKSSSPTQSVS